MFVVASLTGENQFSIVHLASVTSCRQTVSVSWVSRRSSPVSKAHVFDHGLHSSERPDLNLLQKQWTLGAGDLIPHLVVDFGV
jgi:hypothetical protein